MSYFAAANAMSLVVRGLLLVAVSAIALAASASASSALARFACGIRGYTYAGASETRVAGGIEASVSELTQPQVEDGQIAAWVGVGGPGEGRGGSDAWIQIGLDAIADGGSHIYFEVAQPGSGVNYHQLALPVKLGVRYHVAVLETAKGRGLWRVWLNGAIASAAFYLPGSEHWRPIFTGERWSAGAQACNLFAYRFDNVRVARTAGGRWTPFVAGLGFHDRGFQLTGTPRDAFVVASAPASGTVAPRASA
jgi:hypothetical protein